MCKFMQSENQMNVTFMVHSNKVRILYQISNAHHSAYIKCILIETEQKNYGQ